MSVTESKAKTERKSSRKPAKTQETVLSALLAQTEEVSVPLASLIKSPLNVRTVPYSAESVSELADSIKGVGLLQNLVVHALPGDRYGVAAGGRRLAALNMLAERDIIQVDWPVRVKVIPQELATAASITGFEIDVVLNENWPHDLPFDSDNIRLHCVPVINLFPLEADPLHLSPLENEFLLRPMRIQDGHTEIYSVDNIISSRHTGSQAYVPFSSFRHRGGMLRHDAPERYYHTRVKRGPSGLHDTWLILGGDAFDADRMLEDETLSLSLTGTNGHLPRKALQSTLLDRPVHASQNVLRVRNLCAPTQPCYPPARDRFHWRVLSHLGSNFLSMMDNAEILRGTLALYDWTESEMNRRRLEAIVDVQHSLIQRFERGFLLRGVDIQVTLDSNGFAGEGDITLFGELLHRFFALYADIHLFTQLTLILQPTGKCLQWTEHHSQRVPG